MKPKIQRNLAPGRKKDDTVNLNQLPGKPSPYKLEAGEGMRYVIGRHLATVIARAEDLGVAMAGTILSGAKGAHFPLHSHQSTHEAMFVLEGDVSLTLGDKVFELSPGDYVNIPPGTPHAFTYLDHRGKLVAWTFGGNADTLYASLGQPYEGTVYSESSADIDWGCAVDGVDVQFVDHGSDLVASTAKLEAAPGGAVPFVLRGGEGERMLAGEQLYTLMGMAHNSDGLFHSLMTEGPKGPMIPKHMHEKTCETFFCLSGGMEMLVGDEAISLAPGDFLYIPAGVPHAFQLVKNDTRFMGFLTPGNFEQFFRYLCQPFDGYMYPLVPPPFRFDRVIQHLAELDLKLLGRPGGPPPPPPAAAA